MIEGVQYRRMQPDEAQVVCDLVERVFTEFVAPGYEAAGVVAFFDYAQPGLLLQRSENDHFVLVATLGADIIGMIEVRQYRHISLLFVEGVYQGRGIARALMARALDICRRNNPALTELTVNSSPYAEPIYRQMGFHPMESEQEQSGVRYIPMVRVLPAGKAGEEPRSAKRDDE